MVQLLSPAHFRHTPIARRKTFEENERNPRASAEPSGITAAFMSPPRWIAAMTVDLFAMRFDTFAAPPMKPVSISTLKRSIKGTHKNVSPAYLQSYLDGFVFHANNRDSDSQRFSALLGALLRPAI
jgi:hypothetical protein